MLLAVVVSSFNNQTTINKSIDSILRFKEKLKNWDVKITIVDDASTDDTSAVILDYIYLNPIISLKQFAKNGGVSRSRNFGIDSNLDSDYLYEMGRGELDPNKPMR